jgi:hypothetical protein
VPDRVHRMASSARARSVRWQTLVPTTTPPAGGPRTIRSSRLRIGAWLAAAAAFTASALVVVHDDLNDDWFADEMWRANLVRSPHWWELYTSWDTPTPPGFVLFLRAYGWLFPTGPTALRIITVLTLVVTLLLLLRMLLEIIDRAPVVSAPARGARTDPSRTRLSMQIGAFATCVALPLLGAFGIQRTFVPYFLETAFAVALVLLCALLDRWPRAWAVLLAVVIATPWFTIATLHVLGPCVAYLLWWCVRRRDRRRLMWSVATAAVVAAEGLAVYVVAYRPVNKATIGNYWDFASLQGHPRRFGSLLADTWRGVGDGLLSWSHPSVAERFVWPVRLVIAACLVVGLVSLGRRWPALLAVLGGAWVSVVVASAAVGWPMTPERVNLAVFTFAYAAIAFGAMRIVGVATRELAPVAAVATVVAIAVAWPAHQSPLPNGEFLRGLTADLEVIAASPADDNVVLTYHFSTKWYAEDALVTARPGGRHFEVVPETYTDQRVYDPAFVASVVGELPPGGAIWCVIAFDAGPEASERACQVPAGLTPITDVRGTRAVIRGYLTPLS